MVIIKYMSLFGSHLAAQQHTQQCIIQLLGRVPEEAPEAAVQLWEACMSPSANERPNARTVVDMLMSMMPHDHTSTF